MTSYDERRGRSSHHVNNFKRYPLSDPPVANTVCSAAALYDYRKLCRADSYALKFTELRARPRLFMQCICSAATFWV